ncbi:MAG: hypothetical protein WC824_14330, partial [Bacteroidota bacterium]
MRNDDFRRKKFEKSCKQLGTVEERFWFKVNKDGPVKEGMPTACWEWEGATWDNGQGIVCLGKGKVQGANRYAWETQNPPLQ